MSRPRTYGVVDLLVARKQEKRISDVLIIGAGPAGLTAAMYLGRFHRQTLVIDAGESRARWIPTSHNIPGFTQGVGGPELLAQLRTQALSYGARIEAGTVSTIAREGRRFVVEISHAIEKPRFVILATGVKDHFPALAGAEEAVLRSVMRFCPICDGFEATGQRIAVLGNGELGEHEAQFLLQTYSKDVTYLHLGDPNTPGLVALEALGVSVRGTRLEDLTIEKDELIAKSAEGTTEVFNFFYSALGCSPQHQLAKRLGAAIDEKGALTVNAHQETTVEGLYAAGDIVQGLNQVVVAAAEAAIAATDIHNRLRMG